MRDLEGGELLRRERGGFGGGVGGVRGLGGLVCRSLEVFFKVHALAVELAGEEVGVFEADVVKLLPRDIIVKVIVPGLVVDGLSRRCGREFDELAVCFVLHDAVNVPIASVVPDPLRREVHGKAMGGLLVVRKGMGGIVSATAHVATDQTYP